MICRVDIPNFVVFRVDISRESVGGLGVVTDMSGTIWRLEVAVTGFVSYTDMVYSCIDGATISESGTPYDCMNLSEESEEVKGEGVKEPVDGSIAEAIEDCATMLKGSSDAMMLRNS